MGFFLNQVCGIPLKKMGEDDPSRIVSEKHEYYHHLYECEDEIIETNDDLGTGKKREVELKKLFKNNLNTKLVFVD